MQGSYTFEAPLDTVWSALFDPEVLARTLPGCEKLERDGNQFRGDINIKMGPVQGKFEGKVDIVDVKEHESYTMIVDGRGPAGFGKAKASLRVSSEGSGTRLDYDSDVTVGGKIASVGQRLIDASSRAIVKQSLEGLNQQIKALAAAPAAAGATTAPAPPAAAVPGAGSAGSTVPAVPHPALIEGSAPPAVPVAPPAAGSSGAPAGAGARSAAAPSGAAAAPPGPPSQASFVFGVAKQVAKEVFPVRTVLIAIALLVIIWLVVRSLTGD
jgi:carbon monoxide dehydrogenase subunit G